MPPRPFVNDALWRCLCPRWSQVPARTEAALIRSGKKRATLPSIPSATPPSRHLSRPYGAAATAPSAPNVPHSPLSSLLNQQVDHPADPTQVFQSVEFQKSKARKDFMLMTTEELYAQVQIEAAKGRHPDVLTILNILIKERRERPNIALYTALLHSYTSASQGTAGKIRKALEDMAVAGVELDARACECTLEALAVHPDSFLRTDILAYMKERWWSLSPKTENFVVAGMLRERCFEMALERMEKMVREGVYIEGWLWDKAIWSLLEYGEIEEAFYVLNMKKGLSPNADPNLSGSLWQQLLDVAAKKHIPDATSMIWHTQVVPGHLNPSTGTCLNALSVAARAFDIKLATDVFRVLSDRNTLFTPHHYESLLQCYLGANDLPSALHILLIMQDSALKITEDELHPLYLYLKKDPARPMNTFMHLQDLERSGKKIPTPAVNVCIKAAIMQFSLPTAIELYKALSSVAHAGPTTQTFNELFRGCHMHNRKELAMYLAAEMIDLGIAPDRLTYDRLILTCCNAGDLEDAIGYYEEMVAEGMAPRRRTHEMLVQGALKKRDPRCVALLRAYKGAEYSVQSRVEALEAGVRKQFDEGGEGKEKGEESVQEMLEMVQREWEERAREKERREEGGKENEGKENEGKENQGKENKGVEEGKVEVEAEAGGEVPPAENPNKQSTQVP